ncbi:MAG: methylenetetrahydrofolate reductase C-terminal domain-containing protein [Coriobacteriia bacterium]
MIITQPREWERIIRDLESVGAKKVFVIGCGQCATVAKTGGEEEVAQTAARLREEGYEVTGTAVGEVACHLGSARLETRRHRTEFGDADAVVVLSCGAGAQTVAEAAPSKPVFPGLESKFLGNVIRHGVFEERCQMCGECVLDETGGICPVTTCPKGLLNGPCGGMWEGMCEVLEDRECTWVRIHRRLEEQGRSLGEGVAPPKDHSKKPKPGFINMRQARERPERSTEGPARRQAPAGRVPAGTDEGEES